MYSPDMNPIEEIWANAKRIVRKMDQQTGNEIWRAMNEVFWSVTPENISAASRTVSVLF